MNSHGQWAAASLVLEVHLITTVYGDFYVISWASAVDYHGVFSGCFELEVNVTAVAHVEGWQVDCGVDDSEGHNVVEQI